MTPPRERDSGPTTKDLKIPRIITTVPSSRQWSSSYKNPRIVCVSRAFGGKDRHSKVCTVRGLRDRRIRLSVPTAIQLYDLQDRLGLSQPSKVVDWLIEATKHEIEKLPPLPLILPFHGSSPPPPHLSLPDHSLSANEAYAKALAIEQSKVGIKESGEGFEGFVAQNFFPVTSQFAEPNMPYNPSFFHWDPPNLSLSQFGGGFPFSSHTEEQSHHNSMIPSSNDIPQVSMEGDQYFRQINNHFQNLQQDSVLPTTLHFLRADK